MSTATPTESESVDAAVVEECEPMPIGPAMRTERPAVPDAQPASAEPQAASAEAASSVSAAVVEECEAVPVEPQTASSAVQPAAARDRSSAAPPVRWETDDGTSALLTMPQVHALIFKGVLEHVLGRAPINPESIYVVTLAHDAPCSCKGFADAVDDWVAVLQAKSSKEKPQNQLMSSLAKLANALEGINAAMQQHGASDEQRQLMECALEQLRSPAAVDYRAGGDEDSDFAACGAKRRRELLVNGRDVLRFVNAAIQHFQSSDWESFGRDVGGLLTEISGDTSRAAPRPSWWPF